MISESNYQRKLVRVITDHIAGLLEQKTKASQVCFFIQTTINKI